ncbi:MAG: hypothetical protein ACRBI6_23185, partial [Acidimicrobiales bacterium]
MALGMATATRMSISDGSVRWGPLLALAVVAAGAQVAADWRGRGIRNGYRIGSIDDVTHVAGSWLIASVAVSGLDLLMASRAVPVLALITACPFALLMMLGARFTWRSLQDQRMRPSARAR